MNQQLTVQEQRQLQVNDFRRDLARQTKALKAMLPAHIEVEKFQRAAVTAVQHNADLLGADRQSLFNALVRCAGEGLLPDNREAALVLFKGKAQYMPMVSGVIKRLRNSGEISTVEAHIVYEKDEFDFELGDAPRLYHKPRLNGTRGNPILVYCIVNFKDGQKYREVMTIAEVEKARAASKNKDSGPWKDWWDEMAKKTVIHRAAKRLPASADLDKLLKHDMRVTLNPESVEEDEPRENSILANVEEALEGEKVEDKEDTAPEEKQADPAIKCATCGDSGFIDETDGEQNWQEPCPVNCEAGLEASQVAAE